MTEVETHKLDVEGGTLQYDVHGDPHRSGADRPLLMAGFPMDAHGFTTLASHVTNRAVVTYDPRTIGRSSGSTGEELLAPADHADDLHRLIEALDLGPVDLLGSSGGAVNGLALVTAHPEQVHTLVAHEPPIAGVLPDREQLLAACADIYTSYQSSGLGPAMAKFIALIGHQGPLSETYVDQPGPDPADFGLPTEDDGSRNDPMLGRSIRTIPQYEPDFDALAGASTRVVIAAGEESGAEMAARAAAAVAERLGSDLAEFPSHHAGFLGGEYGMRGDPEGFAAALHRALQEG